MSLNVFGIVLVSASDLCSGVLLLTKPWGATFSKRNRQFSSRMDTAGPYRSQGFFWAWAHFRRPGLGVRNNSRPSGALKILFGLVFWWHSWPLVHSFISLGNSTYSLLFCFSLFLERRILLGITMSWVIVMISREAVADWWTTVFVALGRLFKGTVALKAYSYCNSWASLYGLRNIPWGVRLWPLLLLYIFPFERVRECSILRMMICMCERAFIEWPLCAVH